MASKKKLMKEIKTIEKRIKEHEKKLAEAESEEGKHYLIKDINRLKSQKERKEKQL